MCSFSDINLLLLFAQKVYLFSSLSSYIYKQFRNLLFETWWYSDRTVIFVSFVLWSLWKGVSTYVEIVLYGFIFELWFVEVSAYVGSKIKLVFYSWFSEKDFVTYVGRDLFISKRSFCM